MAKSPAFWKQGYRRKRFLYQLFVLLGVGALVALLLILGQPFYTINLWISDQFYASNPPSPNVVIVGIDDASLDTFGRWSDWQRSLHARAIDNLAAAGVRVIGFDVIFADPTADDSRLAESIKKAGNVVLAGGATGNAFKQNGMFIYDSYLGPAAFLNEAAASDGHADVIPDPGGMVRRISAAIGDESGVQHPALSLSVLSVLFNMPLPETFTLEDGALHLFAREITLESDFSLRVNYPDPNISRPYISYADVINGNFSPDLVRNKIVLVGMTASGDIDSWSIPTAATRIPGVYIHAAALDTILKQQYITIAGTKTTGMTLLLMVGSLALALPLCGTWRRLDIVKGTAVALVLFVSYLIIAVVSGMSGNILNILYPSLTIGSVYVSNIIFMTASEQSDKRRVKALFGRYVSPQVSDRIIDMANTGGLVLGGEEREVSVLFADIRNFTSTCEKMSPTEIVSMLNANFSVIIETIFENGGMVNKFAGDNIMAVWNAPSSQPEHAAMAVKAAWDIQEKLSQGVKTGGCSTCVAWGIGINTGNALAGNIGSQRRTEYTVIGDAVNLASRICGIAPGNEIYISPDTLLRAGSRIRVESRGKQNFKGKAEAVEVLRVTGWEPDGRKHSGAF